MSTRAKDPLVPPEPDAPITAARIGDAPASGIPGFHGPFEVGRYAHALREQLRGFARVALIGEVAGAKFAGANLYFELRDRDGALPCAMWRNDFEKSGVPAEHLRDGAQLIAAGGCDFYPGSATSSPSFRFRVTGLRLAGEGDLLAQLERLRRQLASEGLFELQKRLRVADTRSRGRSADRLPGRTASASARRDTRRRRRPRRGGGAGAPPRGALACAARPRGAAPARPAPEGARAASVLAPRDRRAHRP